MLRFEHVDLGVDAVFVLRSGMEVSVGFKIREMSKAEVLSESGSGV